MGLFSKITDKIGDVVSSVMGDKASGTDATSLNNLLPYLASGAVGALGSIGTSWLNDYFSRKASSREFGYNKSLMDYANEYNSPSAMRARLEEAGYNPNLALNGVNVQSATSHVGVQAPKANPIDLLAAYNLEAQNELLGWQTDIAKSSSLLAGRKASIAYYNQQYAEKEYDTFKKTGKIPESYYHGMNAFGSISKSIDQLLQYFSN